jgi:type I restriction enzyme S subunit
MASPGHGWTTVALGDVVKLNKGRARDPLSEGLDRYVGLEHLEPGDLKIRRWGNVADGTTFTNVFRPGHVLFGKRRAYQRKVAVADFSGVCSGDIYVLTPKDDRLLPELLPFLCQTDSFFDHAVGTSAGSLSPRTNWKSLASYEFALPPLDEQERIAGVLDASRRHAEELGTVEERHLTTYRAAVDHLAEELVRGVGVVNPADAVEHPRTVKLDDVAVITDCKHRTPELVDEGVPMVAPGDIKWGPLDLDRCKRISEAEYPAYMDHVTVSEGDLVLSRNQTFGVASYVAEETKFALGQDTVLVQPGSYPAPFIYLMLMSIFVQRQIQRYAAGSTFARINLGDIRQLTIPQLVPGVDATAAVIWSEFESTRVTLSRRFESAKQLSSLLINRLTSREKYSDEL